MTKPTAQEIAGAFYQRENDTRYFINDDHPHADAAKACRDAIADAYGRSFEGMDWSYQVAAEILGYGEEPTEDNAHEIADSLTDIYDHDLRKWFYEYPAIAETAEEEAREYAGPDTTITGRIQQAQYVAYGNAAAAIAQVLAELDDDDPQTCDECGEPIEQDDAGTIAARFPFCTQCTRVIYRDQQPAGDVCNRCLTAAVPSIPEGYTVRYSTDPESLTPYHLISDAGEITAAAATLEMLTAFIAARQK